MNLRQEVSKSEALLLIAAAVGYMAARAVAGPISAPEVVLLLLVAEYVVQPLSTLMHECGHAIVARRVSSGPVSVIVGRGPYVSGTIGGVRIKFGILPPRGVRIRGLCRYDSATVSWRGRAAVSLAGPLVTFLELVSVSVLTVGVWSDAGALIRSLLLLVVTGLCVGVTYNLIPATIIPGVLSNDGSNALRAYRSHRSGAPAPGTPIRHRPVGIVTNGSTTWHPTSVARTNSTSSTMGITPSRPVPPLGSTIDQERDRAGAATSVSPPTPRV